MAELDRPKHEMDEYIDRAVEVNHLKVDKAEKNGAANKYYGA